MESMVTRREHYAGSTLAASEALQDSWAPAIFNMALTNGLLAIAEVELPSEVSKGPSRRTPSARAIVEKLRSKFGDSDTIEIPDPAGQPTVVMCAHLLDAIDATDKPRHGTPAKRPLTRTDIDALVALDDHPALRALHDESLRAYDAYGAAAELTEWGRAADYCGLMGDDEVERRARTAWQHHDPDSGDAEPSECPVCLHTTVIATGADEYGYGITAGTCIVCSYTRSAYAARQENLQLEAERLLAQD
ncbi:MAG: hypothetical protein L0G49_07905 [Luteococcus sp.]|uniref:hypothetical protein n=1 Tax=Luteococcus sp. TaxID=1969402 RepID=UPI002648CFB2|nr:hypothetical protein [Luteococcus sp.]MDN5563681.1 hypothetical protein [Luteococcus sp.]